MHVPVFRMLWLLLLEQITNGKATSSAFTELTLCLKWYRTKYGVQIQSNLQSRVSIIFAYKSRLMLKRICHSTKLIISTNLNAHLDKTTDPKNDKAIQIITHQNTNRWCKYTGQTLLELGFEIQENPQIAPASKHRKVILISLICAMCDLKFYTWN